MQWRAPPQEESQVQWRAPPQEERKIQQWTYGKAPVQWRAPPQEERKIQQWGYGRALARQERDIERGAQQHFVGRWRYGNEEMGNEGMGNGSALPFEEREIQGTSDTEHQDMKLVFRQIERQLEKSILNSILAHSVMDIMEEPAM